MPPKNFHTRGKPGHKLTLALLSFSLFACSGPVIKKVGPEYVPPEPTRAAVQPAWSAPLPHGGDPASLTHWWARWNDAALTELIEAAQRDNPSLDAAAARIAQARAAATMSGARLSPSADLGGSLIRGDQGQGAATVLSASAQAFWEIDLFGGNARTREAALARVEASQVQWHEARVSMAADVAALYVTVRLAQTLLKGFEADVASRQETLRLTTLKVNAGFEAPANARLLGAGLSDAASRVTSTQGDIAQAIQTLAGLTGLSASRVRSIIPSTFEPPKPPPFTVTAVPASVLAQRADLAAVDRAMAAASAEIGVAEADRYPRITLLGNLGFTVPYTRGSLNESLTWGFGPSISFPLFDQGRRSAAVDLARARYAELDANYRALARRAVGEVEDALVRLHNAENKAPGLTQTVEHFLAFERATQSRISVGLGALTELEEVRRNVLAARLGLVNLERERLLAWIALYRALGGGWDAASVAGSKG